MSCCRPDAARTPSADPLAVQLLPAVSLLLPNISVAYRYRTHYIPLLIATYFRTTHTHARARAFNGHFYGTTRVSRYQKGKPIWILLKQETVSGSGINWAICKSVPRSRQITTPPLSFLQAGCPSCRPTNSIKALKADFRTIQ